MRSWPAISVAACASVDDDLDRLRGELQRRFESHPAYGWSSRLLTALIAVFDLEFTDGPSDPEPRPRLRIVR